MTSLAGAELDASAVPKCITCRSRKLSVVTLTWSGNLNACIGTVTAHEYTGEAKAIANFVVVSEAAFLLGHLVGLLGYNVKSAC